MSEPRRLIDLPARAFGRPPYVGKNALMQAGWLRSSGPVLQAYLDRTLNRVAPDRFRAVAASSSLLLTSLHVAEMRSDHPLDRIWGYVPETDIAIWALVLGGAPDRRGFGSLYWTPIYMFVDDPAATAGGREIFGFPKLHSGIRRTGTERSDFGLKITVKAFSAPDPNRAVEDIEILSISGGKLGSVEAPADGLLVVPDPIEAAFTDKSAMAGLLNVRPPSLEFPVLQIKQLPAITNAEYTDYQALVVTKMKSLKVYAAGRATGSPVVRIASPRSMPVAEELGTPAEQPLTNAVWLVQDFKSKRSV